MNNPTSSDRFAAWMTGPFGRIIRIAVVVGGVVIGGVTGNIAGIGS